jgi:hypothetical protein
VHTGSLRLLVFAYANVGAAFIGKVALFPLAGSGPRVNLRALHAAR